MKFLAIVGCAIFVTTLCFAQGRDAKATMILRRAADGIIEIEVNSLRSFPAINAAPEVHIGGQHSRISRYPKDGGLSTLIFSMPAAVFAKTKDGDHIVVKYNPDSQGRWECGKLDKSKLKK